MESNNNHYTDEEVNKMLAEWDKTYCYNCGKEISILNASTINKGQRFVCKNGSCYGK